MKVETHLTNLLKSIGIVQDENGYLTIPPFPGSDVGTTLTVPILYPGEATQTLRPIKIPNAEMIAGIEDNSFLKFCPFSESVFSGQSEVFNKLLIWSNMLLSMTFAKLVTGVTEKLLDVENIGKWDNDAIDWFSSIENLPKSTKNAKEVHNFLGKALANSTGATGSKALVRMRSSRNEAITTKNLPGAYVGTASSNGSFLRATALRVMILEDDFYLTKCPRPSIKASAISIIEKILGDMHEASKGIVIYGISNSNSAPYYESYLATMQELQKRWQPIVKMLVKSDAKFEDKLPSLAWRTWHANFDDLYTGFTTEFDIRFIGNVGNADNARNVEDPEEIDVASTRPAGGLSIKPLHQPSQATVAVKQATPTFQQAEVVEEDEPTSPILHNGLRVARSSFVRPDFNEETKMNLSPDSFNNAGVPRFGAKKPDAVQQPQRTAAVQQSSSPQVAKPSAPQQGKPMSQHEPRREQRNSGGLRIKEAPVQEVQLVDSYGNALWLSNGQPFLIAEDKYPQMSFTQEINEHGRPVFEKDGTPSLVEIRGNSAPRNQAPAHQPQGYPPAQYPPAIPQGGNPTTQAIRQNLYGGNGSIPHQGRVQVGRGVAQPNRQQYVNTPSLQQHPYYNEPQQRYAEPQYQQPPQRPQQPYQQYSDPRYQQQSHAPQARPSLQYGHHNTGHANVPVKLPGN